MENAIEVIRKSIDDKSLPHSIEGLFAGYYDKINGKILLQEFDLLDFKDRVPVKDDDSFLQDICRLIVAFYNTYGGIIVFGVEDKEKNIVGNKNLPDVEYFSRVVNDKCGSKIPIIHQRYLHSDVEKNSLSVDVFLVAKRIIGVPPAEFPDKQGEKQIYFRSNFQKAIANPKNLSFLYTPREYDEFLDDGARTSIENYLPPSPSVIRSYVARKEVLNNLWDWCANQQSEPRFILCGPGGSGKSTIAYEFAKSISDYYRGIEVGGFKFDVVIFLTAKERYLDTDSAYVQQSEIVDFSDERSQFESILSKLHYKKSELSDLSDKKVSELIEEAFDNFNILLVIDDIDTLILNDQDTGMQKLYRSIIRSRNGSKIIYTMRDNPRIVQEFSCVVPGMSEDEYFEFVESCCKQFRIPHIPAETIFGDLYDKTEGRPLSTETILGIRRRSSNIQEAIELFEGRGGKSAREYMFAREYDSLPRNNFARLLLALLSLLVNPISMRETRSILNWDLDKVKDTLVEIEDVFVERSLNEEGEIVYKLGELTRGFCREVSVSVDGFQIIQARVKHFLAHGVKSQELFDLKKKIEYLIRADKFIEAKRELQDSRLSEFDKQNPIFSGLKGWTYSKLDESHAAEARSAFQDFFDRGGADRQIFRAWYYLHFNSGYGLADCISVCDRILSRKDIPDFVRMEFLSKKARAQSKLGIQSQLDATESKKWFASSLRTNFEMLMFGHVNRLDISKNEEFFINDSTRVLNYSIGARCPEMLIEFVNDASKKIKDYEFPEQFWRSVIIALNNIPNGLLSDFRSRRSVIARLANDALKKININNHTLSMEVSSAIEKAIKSIDFELSRAR
ncbi:NB-ARC domain-containing protein [Nisaea nitritireducens]|uniref:NB-ARC domain-containing protein n=1 Tax=Nisaea nitritireducens TaxID=568392 RepID=UPI001867392B|nr:RNA-binding domain-containing protein [Nisaea nitritireducens]